MFLLNRGLTVSFLSEKGTDRFQDVVHLVGDGGHVEGQGDVDKVHFLETECEAGYSGHDHEKSANHG